VSIHKTKNHPEKGQNLSKMHVLTLTLDNEELEMRWTYKQIRKKRPMVIIGYLFITILNLSVVYPHFMHKVFLLQNGMLIAC
jgi:hypothetical protein